MRNVNKHYPHRTTVEDYNPPSLWVISERGTACYMHKNGETRKYWAEPGVPFDIPDDHDIINSWARMNQ